MTIKDSVFFHEDDYCQRELVPVQNLLSKRNEADATKEHSEDALTDDGFITMSIIEETKYPLDRLKISVIDFENILKEHALFYFKQVYTGYSTERILKANIHGFGFENYVLYHESNNNVITKAWIDYNALSDTLNGYPEKLQGTLLKLGIVYDLILVDWNELLTIVLRNESALSNYFRFCRSSIDDL